MTFVTGTGDPISLLLTVGSLVLVGAFSVIVKTDCETDEALHSNKPDNTIAIKCR